MDKQRVWGVRCPDGKTTLCGCSEYEARRRTRWADSSHHDRCKNDHVVVYADIEWKEETE